MTTSEFEQQYIKKRYQAQVQWYSGKASANKKAYQIYHTSIAILSAVITIAVGIGMHDRDHIFWQVVSLTASAAVAVLAGLQRTLRFRENWVEYRTTAEDLKKEEYYHQFRCGDYATSASPDRLFVERAEALISRQNTVWNTATLAVQDDHQRGGGKPGPVS